MPCTSGGTAVPSEPDVEVIDLLQLHAFTADRQFAPRDRPELVHAVAAVTAQNQEVHARGSDWSLSTAEVSTQNVVDTSALELQLCQPFPAPPRPLPSYRLRDGGHTALSRLVRVSGRHFVHVEAGIKIKTLLRDLKSCELALPTMGAGGGQSLAGALSTSTHGADFGVHPLVEWIRAVHLVGPGGQEWWITPGASPFAAEEVTSLPGWCPDTRIVAYDEAFNAVRVAVGRMGVIYSMIVEVVPAYVLVEANLATTWHSMRALLTRSASSVAGSTGAFAAPLTGIDEGWFRTNVVDTIEVGTHAVGGKGMNPAAAKAAAARAHQLRLLHLDAGTLAHDLSGMPAAQLRHLNVAVNLARTEQCWVTRRWAVSGRAVADVHLEPSPPDAVSQAVVAHKTDPVRVVGPLRSKMIEGLGDLELTAVGFGILTGTDPGDALVTFLNKDMPRIATECATSGEAVFLILYRLLTHPVLGHQVRDAVLEAVSMVVGADFARRVRAGNAADVLDTHNYALDGGQSGNSAEFHFNAESGDYLAFAESVVQLASEHFPVLGYMGIRFTPRSTALLAMQRFSLTASVEVATGRARQVDVYRPFWDALHRSADHYNGIPHWGQEFRQSTATIAAHFGNDLVQWRSMLAEMSLDGSAVFSNAFSRDNGLEPGEAKGLFADDALAMFLRALEGSVD